MRKFFLILALIFLFSFEVDALSWPWDSKDTTSSSNKDETVGVICNIIKYAHSLGGPMITVVIIGASLLAIFGRMPWPALFALGMFIAVFFGAPKIAEMLSPATVSKCPE